MKKAEKHCFLECASSNLAQNTRWHPFVCLVWSGWRCWWTPCARSHIAFCGAGWAQKVPDERTGGREPGRADQVDGDGGVGLPMKPPDTTKEERPKFANGRQSGPAK